MEKTFNNSISSVVSSITLSVTASESSDGTTIFNSIQDAIDYASTLPIFKYGQINIKLLDSLYRISSPITISSNKFRKLNIISELPNKSIIDGSIEISSLSWTDEGDGLYKCDIGNINVDDLFVNGKRSLKFSSPLMPFDRIPFTFPSGQSPDFRDDVYHYQVKLGGNNYDDNGLFEKIINSTLNNAYIVLGATFYSCIAHIERVGDYSSSDNSLILHCSSGHDLPNVRNSAYRAIVFGFSELGYEGQWFLDTSGESNYLYYKVKAGEDINELVFSYSTLTKGIEICGTYQDFVNNVSLENLDIRCFYQKIDKYGYYDIQNVSYNSNNGDGERRTIRLEHCDNIEIKNCYIHDCIGSAILLGTFVTKVLIYYNHIYNTPASGICVVKARDVSIDNNIINNIGTFSNCSCGIKLNYTSNISITHNEIFKTKWCGIAFGSDFHFNDVDCYNNYIGYNHIHHCLNGYTSDAALLYMIGKNVGTIVEYNYMHDCFGQVNSHNVGLYFDHGAGGVTVRYNIISCCYTGSINTNPCMHNTLYNNIFAFGGTRQISINSRWQTHSGYVQYIKERFWSFYHNIILFDTSVLFGYNNPYGFYEGTKHIYQDNNLYYNTQFSKEEININSSLFGNTIDIKSLWQNPNFNNIESIETLDFGLSAQALEALKVMDDEFENPFINIDTSNIGTTDKTEEWQEKCTLSEEWLDMFKEMVLTYYPDRPLIWNN